jgi:spermidine/putrescine transport system substrate-binding protein
MFRAQQDAAAEKRPFAIGFATPNRGRNAADVSNLIGAGNPNGAAMHYILPEIAANPGIFPPPANLKWLEMLRDFDPGMRRTLSRMWTEIEVC